MVIIGAGREGRALQLAAQTHGQPCALVSRSEGWNALDGPPGPPVLVATRNDDLEAVLVRVPAHRRADLVFVQNGMLQPWVEAHGLQNTTRGLLFFAAGGGGEPLQPGQSSPFCGPRANLVVHWMTSCGVMAHEVSWPRFKAWEAEKLIWISAFCLMSQAHDCDVQTVVSEHRPELEGLVEEFRLLARAGMNVDIPLDWLVDRLCAYSMTIPTYRGSVKEWVWRNGWFVDMARRRNVVTPTHYELLQTAGLGHRLT